MVLRCARFARESSAKKLTSSLQCLSHFSWLYISTPKRRVALTSLMRCLDACVFPRHHHRPQLGLAGRWGRGKTMLDQLLSFVGHRISPAALPTTPIHSRYLSCDCALIL